MDRFRLIVNRSLLQDIHRFIQKEREKPFLKSLLNKDSRINKIESFYRRIGLTIGAFHVSVIMFRYRQDGVEMS
jgi:hypothetical protein